MERNIIRSAISLTFSVFVAFIASALLLNISKSTTTYHHKIPCSVFLIVLIIVSIIQVLIEFGFLYWLFNTINSFRTIFFASTFFGFLLELRTISNKSKTFYLLIISLIVLILSSIKLNLESNILNYECHTFLLGVQVLVSLIGLVLFFSLSMYWLISIELNFKKSKDQLRANNINANTLHLVQGAEPIRFISSLFQFKTLIFAILISQIPTQLKLCMNYLSTNNRSNEELCIPVYNYNDSIYVKESFSEELRNLTLLSIADCLIEMIFNYLIPAILIMKAIKRMPDFENTKKDNDSLLENEYRNNKSLDDAPIKGFLFNPAD